MPEPIPEGDVFHEQTCNSSSEDEENVKRRRSADFQLMRIPLFCVCESFASHKQKV